MGNTTRNRVKRQTTLTGGRVVQSKTVAKIMGIDTKSSFESFLAANGITTDKAERYASAFLSYHDAAKRGESESEARQSALSAATVSMETQEKQRHNREQKLLKERFRKATRRK
jgi:hypothetical protein